MSRTTKIPTWPTFTATCNAGHFSRSCTFLSNKFRLHQELDRQEGVVALDRTIFEDAEIFATALYQMRKISKRDWETYQGFYAGDPRCDSATRPDDLSALLDAHAAPAHPLARQRKMEQDVPLAYLKRLDRLYEGWIAIYRMSDVLVLETDQLDYINDLMHRLDVMERIEAVLPDEIGKPDCL